MSFCYRVLQLSVGLAIASALAATPNVAWATDILMTLSRATSPTGESDPAVTCKNVVVESIDIKSEAAEPSGPGGGKAPLQMIQVVKKVDGCSQTLREAIGSGSPFDTLSFAIGYKKSSIKIFASPALLETLETNVGKSILETATFSVGAYEYTE